jgi:hypothetical protein
MFKKNCTNLTNMIGPHKRGQNGVGHHYTICWNDFLYTLDLNTFRSTLKEELKTIVLKMDKELHPLSLNMECLHIICVFKLFCRSTFGRLHPLTHVNMGLIHYNILHYYWNQSHSIRLTIVIEDILDYNFLWFPKESQCIEEIKQCR